MSSLVFGFCGGFLPKYQLYLQSESLVLRGAGDSRRHPWRGGGSFPRAPEKSTEGTPAKENTASLLSHGKISGDFDFKDHNDENHFLARYVDSKVAARTYLDQKTRKRWKLQVKCSWASWKRTTPRSTQRIAIFCIVAIKIA